MAKKTTISFSLENRKKTDDDVRISRIVGDSVYGYRQLNILPHKYRCELLPEKRNFSVDLTSDGVYEFAIYRYLRPSMECVSISVKYFILVDGEIEYIKNTEVAEMILWFDEILGKEIHQAIKV